MNILSSSFPLFSLCFFRENPCFPWQKIFSKRKETLKSSFDVILDELQPYSQNPKYRELIRKLWCYVVDNAEKLTETDAEEIETKIREIIGDHNMPTLAQIYTVKGRVEGKAEGKAEGKVEDRIEAIIELLEDNFGDIPQATKDAVAKITDLVVLRRLTLLAGKCKSLAEFKKALK